MTTVRLSGTDELIAAIGHAGSVALASYILTPGRVVAALEAAGDRGATVSVRLESAPMENEKHTLAEQNVRMARELESHHVRVAFTPDGQPSHLKGAVVDGCAFLDDRNWPDDRIASAGPSTMIADADADDVAVVRAGIGGERASDAHLWTRKDDALRAEARLLHNAGRERVTVESESFGPGAVARELEQKARAGNDVRLLVCDREAGNPRERAVLRKLAAAGVQIRTVPFDEKIAVAGKQAWVGSANAGIFPPDQVDWGMRTRVPGLVDALRARFDQNWNSSKALASVAATTSSSDISSKSARADAVSAT